MKTTNAQPEQEDADRQWIEARLQAMTLPEKIGQMIFLNLTTAAITEKAGALQRLKHAVQKLHIGGLKIQGGDFHDYAQIANTLQQASATPLLFCGDFERGVGERFAGAVRFPPAMALGAITQADFTLQVARAIAQESRAAGIPLIFAPVADVNTKPDNPVINVRSFGENPVLVARRAVEFIRGAQEAGALTTAKHFPGHGDVSEDSHLNVALSSANLEQLQASALVPFAASMERILAAAKEANLMMWNIFIGPTCYSGKIGMQATLAQALARLRDLHQPILAIAFGDPYVFSAIPYVDAYLCAYDDSAVMQEAAFAALTGRAPISGRLPVTIPGYFRAGEGMIRRFDS